jgi:hypothetical protein
MLNWYKFDVPGILCWKYTLNQYVIDIAGFFCFKLFVKSHKKPAFLKKICKLLIDACST